MKKLTQLWVFHSWNHNKVRQVSSALIWPRTCQASSSLPVQFNHLNILVLMREKALLMPSQISNKPLANHFERLVQLTLLEGFISHSICEQLVWQDKLKLQFSVDTQANIVGKTPFGLFEKNKLCFYPALIKVFPAFTGGVFQTQGSTNQSVLPIAWSTIYYAIYAQERVLVKEEGMVLQCWCSLYLKIKVIHSLGLVKRSWILALYQNPLCILKNCP